MLDGEQVTVQTDGLATWPLAFGPGGPKRTIVGEQPLHCTADLSLERCSFCNSLRLHCQRQPLLEDCLIDARCCPVWVVADNDDTLPSVIGQSGRGLRLKPCNPQPSVVAFDLDVEIDAGQALQVRLA